MWFAARVGSCVLLANSPMRVLMVLPGRQLGQDMHHTASTSVLKLNKRLLTTSTTNSVIQARLMLLGGPRTMYVLGLPLCAQTDAWQVMLPIMVGSLCASAFVSNKAAATVKEIHITASITQARGPCPGSQAFTKIQKHLVVLVLGS